MLEKAEVARDADAVAKKNFGAENVKRIIVEPMVDSDGDDTWRVTIVIDRKVVDTISGDAVLDNLIEIHNCLWEKGEQGIPSVEFTTEAELNEIDDSES